MINTPPICPVAVTNIVGKGVVGKMNFINISFTEFPTSLYVFNQGRKPLKIFKQTLHVANVVSCQR